MLKRTIGRSLLGLLVITGLAGTINDSSLSKKERKYATSLMKSTKDDALQSVRNLSEAQLNYKATPESWSVKECMYHIATSEKLLWATLEKSMKEPANPEKRNEIKVTDEQFVAMMEDRSKKFKTAEPFEPKNSGYESLMDATEEFKKNRMDHIKYVKNSTEDLRNHVIAMPFGSIDAYQLCLMIASHSNRHTQQINEVKASPGFPSK